GPLPTITVPTQLTDSTVGDTVENTAQAGSGDAAQVTGSDFLTVSPILLNQGAPKTATVASGAGYSSTLTVTNANPTGSATFAETSSADSGDVVVASDGSITAPSTLAVGSYTVGGTDADGAGDGGTWSFTLTVSPVLLNQGAPKTATVASGAGYSSTLTVTNANPTGSATFAETSSADSGDVVVASDGSITPPSTLAVGSYTVGGTDADGAGDGGTWSFTLTVTPILLHPGAPRTATVASGG